MSINPGFVRDAAKVLQQVDLSANRAAELAIEIERLNETVRRASASLTFDDEPATFASTLERRAP